MKHHPVDEEFNEIVLNEIKFAISKAFICLEASLRGSTLNGISINDKGLSLVRRKGEEMKKEVNAFIDAQIKMIIDEPTHPTEIDFRDSV